MKRTAPAALLAATITFLAACSSTGRTTVGSGSAPPVASVPAPTGTPTVAATDSATVASTPVEESTLPPLPTYNPDGRYSGTCDYSLTRGFSYAHAGDFIGQVSMHNTGNVGIKVTVLMRWAQLGYAPTKLVKQIRVPVGGHETVRFHKRATSTMIDRYQSAEGNRGTACHYTATITDSFGHPR